MSVIQQLKKNEKPFGLMGENDTEHNLMRDKMLEIGYRNCQVFRGNWGDFDQPFDRMSNRDELTFRLRPDYTDEPEIVECEIRTDEYGDLVYKGNTANSINIDSAFHCPDFIGFKFEDGIVTGLPIRYKMPGGVFSTFAYKNFAEIEVLHASHVLIRESK